MITKETMDELESLLKAAHEKRTKKAKKTHGRKGVK